MEPQNRYSDRYRTYIHRSDKLVPLETISIPSHLKEFISDLMEGGYASASEVIAEALHCLKEQEDGRLRKLEFLYWEVAAGTKERSGAKLYNGDDVLGALEKQLKSRQPRKRRS